MSTFSIEVYGDHRGLHVLTRSFLTRRSSDLRFPRHCYGQIRTTFLLWRASAGGAGLAWRRIAAGPWRVRQDPLRGNDGGDGVRFWLLARASKNAMVAQWVKTGI